MRAEKALGGGLRALGPRILKGVEASGFGSLVMRLVESDSVCRTFWAVEAGFRAKDYIGSAILFRVPLLCFRENSRHPD